MMENPNQTEIDLYKDGTENNIDNYLASYSP